FENVSIISFNYDRCIERYLPTSLANFYSMDVSETRAIMKEKLRIIRPYGIAGLLDWMAPPPSKLGLRDNEFAKKLIRDAELIRTISEGIGDSSIGSSIKDCLSNAQRVIFLGFAFHDRNMEVTKVPVQPNTEILATAHAVSDSDQEVIRALIHGTFEVSPGDRNLVTIAPVTCKKLFEEYSRTIIAPPTR
ncbi:MAG: hypothetical protein N2422_05555, partial [Rhodobacteraceae bacterium]|nr:hypothetical protein [Paracoccaceae bacterium]